MRVPASLLLLLAASSACAPARTLSADVEYSFIDNNGVGWVTLDGEVTVTLTFTGKDGSLGLRGKRGWVDSVLTDSADGLDSSNWEGEVDETIPLVDVRRRGKTITFELDPFGDHLTGICAPTQIRGLDRTTLYECTIAGFQWEPIADLPELHHPIVLDADADANTRIVNSMTGDSKPGFGQRVVRDE